MTRLIAGMMAIMQAPADITAWRKARRAELLERRQAVAPAQHHAWNESVTRHLIENFPQLAQWRIGIYWPFKGEFDPRFALRAFCDRGASAALPVVVARGQPLEFRAWWPGVATTPGVFGLPVPVSETVRPDALLIPPVGFDAQGYRLGYGGGYFDRTLAALSPQPLKIAVAFEISRMDTIHPQPHDIPMDFIVTENGVRRIAAQNNGQFQGATP